jgi:selenocysteine lyase/cysteine desulfurase
MMSTDASGYAQPSGERRSYLLIDGAQLVPGTVIDFRSLGADYLAFSFHKILAPFGVGVLVAREPLLEASPPFLYGGDMVAEGRVSADRVAYNALPWKYAAGTPNIIGTIVSAQALRLLLDLALAHQALGIDASCRLSFYLYNTVDEVERAVDALAAIVSARRGASESRAAQGSTRNLSARNVAPVTGSNASPR